MTTKNDQTGKAETDPSKTTGKDFPAGAPEAAQIGRQQYEQTADARRAQDERKKNLEAVKEAERNADPKPTGEGENPHAPGETDQTATPDESQKTGREG